MIEVVIIESPFAGRDAEELEKHKKYAYACMVDSISKGEAPFLSHMLYTNVLEDSNPTERMAGMQLGFAWMAKADKVVVYVDCGISPGMQEGIAKAHELNKPVEFRAISDSVLKSVLDTIAKVYAPKAKVYSGLDAMLEEDLEHPVELPTRTEVDVRTGKIFRVADPEVSLCNVCGKVPTGPCGREDCICGKVKQG